MVLLAGARQAGKTTLSRQLGLKFTYLNFDSPEDRLRLKQWDPSARGRLIPPTRFDPANALQCILTVGGFPEPFRPNDETAGEALAPYPSRLDLARRFVGLGEGPSAVACALQREIHQTEDFSGRKASLCFLRDKEKREVDFVVVVDRKPRQLIDAKWSEDTSSKSLGYFRGLFPAALALHVVRTLDLPREDRARSLRMLPATDYLAEVSFPDEPAQASLRRN